MRRRSAFPALPLFPFLSVLICAIGSMVVVFSGTALTSLESTRQTFVVSIREAAAVRQPGEAWERQPIYVICDGAGLTVYRSASDVEWISAARLAGPEGDALLGRLASSFEQQRDKRWPVIFVKPSGVETMEKLYALLRDRRVTVGKWAFAEESTIVCEAADAVTGGAI